MGEALKKWGSGRLDDSNIPPTCQPGRKAKSRVEERAANILVDKPHHLWDVYLPHVLFSVRNRENRNTGQSPAKLMFGREIKAPGDWQLELAEGSPDAERNGPELSGAVRNLPVEIEDSPVERNDAPVVEGGDPVVSGSKAPNTHIPPESPGRSNLSVGDWVYYKAHPQSSAEKRFHAGFAPKWLGPVKLDGRTSKPATNPQQPAIPWNDRRSCGKAPGNGRAVVAGSQEAVERWIEAMEVSAETPHPDPE
eukprot:XP_016656006.1 PREDICTED: uncharacterized protein LOC107882319 [Acyrthosiphon pisum]